MGELQELNISKVISKNIVWLKETRANEKSIDCRRCCIYEINN